MRRLLLAAVLVTGAVLVPSASAVDVVKCVTDNNRIGFPYGGYQIEPVDTANCIRPLP